ncbi:S9 family peptidase [Mesotoga prima]|uniref:S9 family peptidase n=1 Tax=Mesotoga prima TaxID=1184387 RepID=UPI002C98C4A3|nr:S9 family peptidase [Mesotoga prima]HQC13618.1 S9 family peptidase [Mesotoga prima]
MKKLKLEDLYKYSAVGDLHIFPGGENFVFVRKTMNKKENQYESNIWLGNMKNEEVRQLTRGGKDGSPVVSPDGKSILFVSKRDKEAKGTGLYLLPLEGGESRLVKTLKGGFSSVSWIDSETVLFMTKHAPGEDPEKIEEDEPPEKKVYEIDRIPFVSNGAGFTENRVGHLYKMKLENGKMEPITAVGGDIESIVLSPERKSVAVITTEDREKRPIWSSLYLLDLQSETAKRIGDDSLSFYHCEWSDDSELFAVATDFKKGFPTNPFIVHVDLESFTLTTLAREMDLYFGNSLNSDVRGVSPNTSMKVVEGKLYSLVTAGSQIKLVSMDKEGKVEEIAVSSGSIDCFDVAGEELLLSEMTTTEPLEIYSLVKGKKKKLTSFNSWMKGIKLSKPEGFEVEASDGQKIEGWIMRPVDFEEGKKYPAVVEIHGGPKTAYGGGYIHEFQTLASEGYAVIYCNPRGSAGYGTDFADIRGHYGERDFEDIMEIVEYVINEHDFVDEERLGVTGGSYGGFMTNWIVGHTDAFKAAVSQRSISSWISFFGTTDIGYYFANDQTGGDFFDNLEGYLRQSPLMSAPNVVTPILFIHSLEDYRCWVPEAMQFFTALRYLGKEAKMVLFPKENHELSRGGLPIHREKRLRAILEWFDSHLKT